MKIGVTSITSPLVRLCYPKSWDLSCVGPEWETLNTIEGYLGMMIAMLDTPRLRAGGWSVRDVLHTVHLPAEISISMKAALARVSDLKRDKSSDKSSIGIWSSTFRDKRSRAQLERHVRPKADGGQGC